MKLTIVGCTGSFPGPGSPASCYLLTADSGGRRWKIILDLGSGALGSLQRYTDLEDIDAIFLSHLVGRVGRKLLVQARVDRIVGASD